MMTHKALAGSLVAVAVALGGGSVLLSRQASPTDRATAANEFCNSGPAEAQVTADQARNHRYTVHIPRDPPPIGLPVSGAHSIAKGDVVEFAVTSPRGGAVAVHGLFDARPVAAGGVVQVAFRAIYTGRFALHFHGDDGSHFEIAALEVRPSTAAASLQAGR